MGDPSSEFRSVKYNFDTVLRESRLEQITREVNDLSTLVNKLPEEIRQVRDRGYAFRSYLERKAEVFAKNWDEIRRNVVRAVENEIDDLKEDIREAEEEIKRGDRLADTPERLEKALDQIKGVIDRADKKVDAASNRLRNMYSTLKSDVDSTNYQLSQIKWICDRKEEASFNFLAGESVFLVAEAEWVKTGDSGDDPDGLLYLTDQRLLFEQKEKVGKRFGFFGGEQVQELEFEIPLNHIEKVEDENRGMFGGKDMLHFTLRDGPYPRITVEVKGSADNSFWVKQINRMLTGEANDERAIAPDVEMLDRLKSAPTQCHVCGATLPMLTAGQLQIECEYCGAVIRL